MICPTCRTESPGPYCAGCGAHLQGAKCAACGSELLPGARFCTACGGRVGGGRAGSLLPWGLAGAGVVLAVALVLVPNLRGPVGEASPAAGSMTAAPFAAGGSGSPPPLTGTPREQADRLFNRIMQEREAGDTARARFFVPMALAAYEQAEPLDDDGLYHLSLVRTFAGDAAGGLATAERVLASSPGHVLALAAAAEAADALGTVDAARAFYRRFLEALPAERGRPLPEYQHHARILPDYERAANAYLAR